MLNAAYSSDRQIRTPTRYVDPIVKRYGYTEPDLTLEQHCAILSGCAVTTAILERPILKCVNFGFLSSPPGALEARGIVDKRAEFFRVLFTTKWYSGTPLALSIGHYGGLFSLYAYCKSAYDPELYSEWYSGAVSGAKAGVAYTVVKHPFDVLRATAQAPGPKKFSGAFDVLATMLRHKPGAVSGLYKGFGNACAMNVAQYSVMFWWYNVLREDMGCRGNLWLFCACYLGSCYANIIAYPFMNLRRLVVEANQHVKLKQLTGRMLFKEMKKKHGASKVYDGFFTTRPWIAAIPMTLMLMSYDLISRRYTEYLYPNRKAKARPYGNLFQVKMPSYITDTKTANIF